MKNSDASWDFMESEEDKSEVIDTNPCPGPRNECPILYWMSCSDCEELTRKKVPYKDLPNE